MMELTQNYNLDKIINEANCAKLLDDADRSTIGMDVAEGVRTDLSSREEWQHLMANAMKLTTQVVEQKSEPWAGASNVKFPLVTIAALQFHARIYPLLVPGPDVAKMRVIGEATSEKTDIARRVSTHMSWQLLEQDAGWEENHDKALLVEAIMGDVFKKTYFDPERRYTVTEMVSPADLVVNYWCKTSIDMAPRATHIRKFSRNQVTEKVRKGLWFDKDFTPAGNAEHDSDELVTAAQQRQGVQAPPLDDSTPTIIYEQLCWYDLDGDGYMEPYIATVEEDGTLRRLVARFTDQSIQKNKQGQVSCIEPLCMYNRYTLIPAPDGGFYGLGFGRLLGPINDSVNTALNQLFDAGTLSNYGGGFLGRGARFRGGQYTFKPQEWKQVDSPGDDLRKNIVPLPVREPSDVLFKLMGFLVQYGERIASANDIQMGENVGQNTPAETARTMNANGQRILAAMYKRQWRAVRDELRIRHEHNKVYITADVEYMDLIKGTGARLLPGDYDAPSTTVVPVADPVMVDDGQRIQNAEMVMGLAFKLPGFNKYLTMKRYLEVTKTPDIDLILPPPPAPEGAPEGTVGDFPSGPDPKMLEIQVKQGLLKVKEGELQIKAQDLQVQMQSMQIEQAREAQEMQMDLIALQTDIQLKQAQIYNLQAQATKALAEAKGVETGHMVGILQTQMAGLETQVRMMELQAQKLKGAVDMKLGRLKIIEAAVKTTGAIHDVRGKVEDRAAEKREAGMATTAADQETAAAVEGLSPGNVPLLG